MKRFAKTLSLVISFVIAISCMAIPSYATGENYLTFSGDANCAMVKKCSSGARGLIEIPSSCYVCLGTLGSGDSCTYAGISLYEECPVCEEINKMVSVPVTEIGVSAFDGITGVTGIVVPSSVTKVGDLAFANCVSLQSVEFKGAECTLGTAVFRSCGKLSSVTLPSALTTVPKQAFFDCPALVNITIPASVTTIGSEAFATCTALESVTIPAKVSSIGSNAFIRCSSVESYAVESGNVTYKAVDGVLYDATGRTLIQYPGGSDATSVTVASSAKVIGDGAFAGNRKIKSVVFPEDLEKIEAYAFQYCESLENVTLSPYIKTLGVEAFGHCTALKSIEIPSTLTTYEYAFYMSGLESVTIRKGAQAVSRNAFEKCDKLTSVSIPESVTAIGVAAFIDCEALEKISIPASVTSIGNKAFSGCNSLVMTVEKDSAAHTYAQNNSIAFSFSGSSGELAVTGIEITKLPAKLDYNYKDKFNKAGMVVVAKYSDGSQAEITDYTVTPDTFTKTGSHKVTVEYEGYTDTVGVTVSYSFIQIIILIFLLGFLWY